jgi:Polyketide cyclase / dehydrase and lipid transport
MSVCRYQVTGHIGIAAPIEHTYAIASDPNRVPSYESGIVRIEVVRRVDQYTTIGKSVLRIMGRPVCFVYRYHFRPPCHYSGVQEGRALLRGYFTMAFRPSSDGTTVSHTEGLVSSVPFLAWAAGCVYFRLLSRGGITLELERLKALVERSSRV